MNMTDGLKEKDAGGVRRGRVPFDRERAGSVRQLQIRASAFIDLGEFAFLLPPSSLPCPSPHSASIKQLIHKPYTYAAT